MMSQLANPSSKRFKVYIVDDDIDDREILKYCFDLVGCAESLHFFDNGTSLLSHLATASPEALPQLILLDEQISTTREGALAITIRQQPTYDNIALVIYAGQITATLRRRLSRYNIDEFM